MVNNSTNVNKTHWTQKITCHKILEIQVHLHPYHFLPKFIVFRGRRGCDRMVIYLCNHCLSPVMLWVRISIRARYTTLCDKVYQWLETSRWFSPGPPVSCTNKTDRHDITEILLKVALNTIKQTNIVFIRLTQIIHRAKRISIKITFLILL
jgi:hypothetical protein